MLPSPSPPAPHPTLKKMLQPRLMILYDCCPKMYWYMQRHHVLTCLIMYYHVMSSYHFILCQHLWRPFEFSLEFKRCQLCRCDKYCCYDMYCCCDKYCGCYKYCCCDNYCLQTHCRVSDTSRWFLNICFCFCGFRSSACPDWIQRIQRNSASFVSRCCFGTCRTSKILISYFGE